GLLLSVYHQGVGVEVEHGPQAALLHYIDGVVLCLFCIVIIHKGGAVLREYLLIQSPGPALLFVLQLSDLHPSSPVLYMSFRICICIWYPSSYCPDCLGQPLQEAQPGPPLSLSCSSRGS